MLCCVSMATLSHVPRSSLVLPVTFPWQQKAQGAGGQDQLRLIRGGGWGPEPEDWSVCDTVLLRLRDSGEVSVWTGTRSVLVLDRPVALPLSLTAAGRRRTETNLSAPVHPLCNHAANTQMNPKCFSCLWYLFGIKMAHLYFASFFLY